MIIAEKLPFYIDYHSVDTYLSHVECSIITLIPGASHEKHVSSQDSSNVYQLIVLVPNGPSYNYHSTPLTISDLPTSDFHSHPHNTCMPKPDYTSPGTCHTVTRKFIEDRLLPKWVSTFIWTNGIVNKLLNNNHNNNNIDFLVPENLVLNMSDLQLTDIQISLISISLFFCPTTGEPDMGQVFLDLERLFKKMRVTLFWALDQSQDTSAIDTQSANSQNNIEFPPYHNSDFTAKSVHLNQGLEPFQKSVKHCIYSQPIRASMIKNVTFEEIQALKELFTNQDIIIKRLTKVHVSASKIIQHIFKNACLS